MVEESRNTQRIGFLLTPRFGLLSFAAAIEPLRAANLLSRSPLYEVVQLSVDGKPVRSSSGNEFACRNLRSDGELCHSIFVCAGGNPEDWTDVAPAYPVLRRLARQGIRIGAISSGAYLLAAAGVLQNYDFTIHWEHAPLLRETFPELSPRQARYVIDRDRVTCGGGIAPLDLMHALIRERMGSIFARRVSDWFLHTAVAEPTAPQRGSTSERFGTNNPVLVSVLEKMEASIDRPLSRAKLAAFAGVSERQLNRLFREHLNDTFSNRYMTIRLQYGRRLVEQSPLSISEIAFATGFANASHFTSRFMQWFAETPTELRKKLRQTS